MDDEADEMSKIGGEFTSLLDLPAEVIEHVLASSSLGFIDVLNASAVCSKLHAICQNNNLWKSKFSQRWPHMLTRYDRLSSYKWQNEYRDRHLFGKKVRLMVEDLSPKHYLQDEVSKEDFHMFSSLVSEHERAGEFLVDQLMDIVNDGQPDKLLTLKYYAVKVLQFMQHKLLSGKIKAFVELPVEKQHLEIGAALLAQWCQPVENFTVNDISDQLDRLAAEVRTTLQKTWPQHPAIKADIDPDSVTADFWTCDECQKVLDALNRVLFSVHSFKGNQSNYYDINNSFINQVLTLKTGIPITLSIVYAGVARRVGVICEPVNSPSHFLLRWKQDPMNTKEHMYTYIDVYNGGKFLSYAQLPATLGIPEGLINLDSMEVTNPTQVLQRMIRNLIAIGRERSRMGDNLLCLRNAIEFFLQMSKDDFELRLLLVRVNLHLNINLPDVIQNLELIADEDQNRMGLVAYLLNAAQTQLEENKARRETKKIKTKTRRKPKDALFSVGLIMKHKRYHYNCVIYGWDPKCQATREWILQMGVHNLPHKDKQPFYNVLVEDGTNRYAAEESLEFNADIKAISHPEVGKYFTEYKGTHYIPNNEKAAEYPDDIDMTAKLVHQNYSG